MTKRKSSTATPDKQVAGLRRDLDRLDAEILTAINRRAELAKQIGETKQAVGETIVDPVREDEVIRRAVETNPGPLHAEAVRAVFSELISGSRAVQTSLRVAYLGPEYTFSHLAAIARFAVHVLE